MKKNYLFLLALLCCAMYSCKEKQDANAEAESTASEGSEYSIISEEFSLESDSTTMNLYMAYRDDIDSTAPGVLVIHEWWGHNSYTRERADMLAELGYVALALDMYGEGKIADHPSKAGEFAGMVMSNLDDSRKRFEVSYEALKANANVDSSRIAAVGYCFGGSFALCMANYGYDLAAVAAFHSGVTLPVPPSENTKARILVCNGEADPMISAESAQAFKDALDALELEYEYNSYPGATHAFTNPDADSLGAKFELPLAYNAEADAKAWEALKNLLAESFTE